jgi:hypothetical protein
MAIRKERIALVLLVTLCLTGGFGHASEKAYQAGRLVSVQSPEQPIPLPNPIGSQPIVFPLHNSRFSRARLHTWVTAG